MTDLTAHAAAVQIAEQVWDESPTRPGGARAAMLAVVAALARAGLLANPGELAALRTVAELARERTGLLDTDAARPLLAALAKLDALPAPPPGEDFVVRTRTTADMGSRLMAAPCRSCGRPFSPTHDSGAPGPTSRHPFMPVAR